MDKCILKREYAVVPNPCLKQEDYTELREQFDGTVDKLMSIVPENKRILIVDLEDLKGRMEYIAVRKAFCRGFRMAKKLKKLRGV